ncbi:hypothetical protein N7493_004466 [Penicillium malachiteum]|uniref:Nucleoside phosphorylase domain-containing protein n=1 Tax=Penicillium malachiteum TaxID=1324776 RepID=A0AAD6HNP8_9EURO|nr:hypothetical protein N7493_004466 [Penicillium malachiteum]
MIVGWIRSAITRINQKATSQTGCLIISHGKDAILRPSARGYQSGNYLRPTTRVLCCASSIRWIHPNFRPPHNDPNTYCLGTVCHHKVVATCLPAGEYGNNSATDVASNMKRSFSRSFRLLVGIGGGVPTKEDIRLGDVVVSKRTRQNPAIIQCDEEKVLGNGVSQQIEYLNLPPRELMTALSNLQSDPHLSKAPLQEYLDVIASFNSDYRYPGTELDRLFSSSSIHIDGYDHCDNYDPSYLHFRRQRLSTHPIIHYGLIASANKMEAAGVVNTIPCLVIRGICDHSDCHKNKRFQNYAAASAESFAKLLLSYVT